MSFEDFLENISLKRKFLLSKGFLEGYQNLGSFVHRRYKIRKLVPRAFGRWLECLQGRLGGPTRASQTCLGKCKAISHIKK